MHPESYRPVVFWCNDIHYADRKFLREYHTQFLVGKKQNKNDPWWSFKLNQEISSISNKFFLQAWADSIFSVTNGKAQRAMSDFMTLFYSRLLVFHKIGTDPLACLKKVNLFPEIRRRKTAGILSQSLCLLVQKQFICKILRLLAKKSQPYVRCNTPICKFQSSI